MGARAVGEARAGGRRFTRRGLERLLEGGLLRLTLAALAFLWFAPVLWMFSTAIKREGTILQWPIVWIPPARNLTLENFHLVIDNFPVFH